MLMDNRVEEINYADDNALGRASAAGNNMVEKEASMPAVTKRPKNERQLFAYPTIEKSFLEYVAGTVEKKEIYPSFYLFIHKLYEPNYQTLIGGNIYKALLCQNYAKCQNRARIMPRA